MFPSRPSIASSIPALIACTLGSVGVTSVLQATAAHAGIKSISIDKQTSQFDALPAIVMKDSGNGYVLDKTESAKIRMRIRAKADKKNGLNNVLTVAKAELQNRTIYTLPLNYRPVELDETVEALVGANDLQPYVESAASKCNLGGKIGDTVKVPFYFGVLFQVWDLGPSEHRTASETFQGVVSCGPRKIPKGPGDVAADLGDFKVKGIAARFLTTAGKPASPNPGTKCQVTTARVRVETSKPGPVKFKLWTKIGDETNSQVVDAWSSFTGPGKYEAVYEKKINVERSTPVQIMAEEMVNPIGLSTPWKLAHLYCDGAGGGGLATPGSGANPDDPIIPSLKVTGNVSLGTMPGSGAATKPRDASVVFRLWANKPGNTSYKLTCSNGHEWTGTSSTVKTGPGKYMASGVRKIHIAQTTQLACALRSTSMSGNPVVALASKNYVVVKRNPDTRGPDQVTTAPRPTHKPDSKPSKLNEKATPAVDRVPAPRPAVRPTRVQSETKRKVVQPIKPARAARSGADKGTKVAGGKETFDVKKPHARASATR